MKKKGILLLGSLVLMVVAMVFIAVTLISRASVAPTTSDAATPKRKDILPLTSSSTSSKSSVNKYVLKKYDSDFNKVSIGLFINEAGYILGNEFPLTNDVISTHNLTIWNPDGKYSQLTDKNFKEAWAMGLNDSNVIVGGNIDIKAMTAEAFTYSESGGYKKLEGLPITTKAKPNTKLNIKKVLTTKYSKFNLGQLKEFGKYNIDDYSDTSSFAYDLNNQNDIVGQSNNIAVLWVEGKSKPIDLSLNFKKNDGSIINSSAVSVSNRINDVIKVLVVSYEDSGYFGKESLHIIDYDSAKQKVIAYKKIESVLDGNFISTIPMTVLSDETVISNHILQSEKGYWFEDGYVYSPKGDYSVYTSLKSILLPKGINSDYEGIFDVNDNKIGTGWYGFIDSTPYPKNFIIDLSSNNVTTIEDMIRNGKIIGYEPGMLIYLNEINSKGEIQVTIQSQTSPFTSSVGKLVPAN
jgi:hypothetical protein